jgi:ribonuclease P protein component
MQQTFQKVERLKSKVVIEELISKGKSIKKYPFVILWKKAESSQEFPIRIAFSIPKKRFPLAVDRNQMKRKINEIYRQHKAHLYTSLKDKYVILLIFTSSEKMSSLAIENKLILLFNRFILDVEETN